METHTNYKKLYRFAAPFKNQSLIEAFIKFMEKSKRLSSIKLNMSVKTDILSLEVYCNTIQDFDNIKDDLFEFFKVGQIKNFFMRYYDLENGKYIINPKDSEDGPAFHNQAYYELFQSNNQRYQQPYLQ